jgi:hypothetical protein
MVRRGSDSFRRFLAVRPKHVGKPHGLRIIGRIRRGRLGEIRQGTADFIGAVVVPILLVVNPPDDDEGDNQEDNRAEDEQPYHHSEVVPPICHFA